MKYSLQLLHKKIPAVSTYFTQWSRFLKHCQVHWVPCILNRTPQLSSKKTVLQLLFQTSSPSNGVNSRLWTSDHCEHDSQAFATIRITLQRSFISVAVKNAFAQWSFESMRAYWYTATDVNHSFRVLRWYYTGNMSIFIDCCEPYFRTDMVLCTKWTIRWLALHKT